MDPILSFGRPARAPSYAELERLADDQLMARLQADCHDALAILFDRYHRLIFSIALKIVRDRGEAEDVMQNVFLDIFRAKAQFDPSKGSTRVWMLQYAHHRAINHRQQLNARSFYDQNGGMLRTADGSLPLPFVSCKKAEEKVKEEAAYLVGMEEYVYGYPFGHDGRHQGSNHSRSERWRI